MTHAPRKSSADGEWAAMDRAPTETALPNVFAMPQGSVAALCVHPRRGARIGSGAARHTSPLAPLRRPYCGTALGCAVL